MVSWVLECRCECVRERRRERRTTAVASVSQPVSPHCTWPFDALLIFITSWFLHNIYIYINRSNWTIILIVSLTYPKVFSYLNPRTGPVYDGCQRLALNKNNNKPSRFSWGISFVVVQQSPARHMDKKFYYLEMCDLKCSILIYTYWFI